MAVLEPKLAILDETDSGLDIDALRIVANGVNKLKHTENAQLLITLPTAAKLHRSGLCSRVAGWPYCAIGRAPACARTRGKRVRVDYP